MKHPDVLILAVLLFAGPALACGCKAPAAPPIGSKITNSNNWLQRSAYKSKTSNSWTAFHHYYKNYIFDFCDEFITKTQNKATIQKLLLKGNGLKALDKVAHKDPDFQTYVLGVLKSDPASDSAADRIDHITLTKCPLGHKDLCTKIHAAFTAHGQNPKP